MIKCMTWVCDYNNGNECCHEKGTCDCRIIPESEQTASAPVDSQAAGSIFLVERTWDGYKQYHIRKTGMNERNGKCGWSGKPDSERVAELKLEDLVWLKCKSNVTDDLQEKE